MSCPVSPPPLRCPVHCVLLRHDVLSIASSSAVMSCPVRPPPSRCPVHCVLLRHDVLSIASSSVTMSCPVRPPPPRCPVHCVLLRHDVLSSASSSTTSAIHLNVSPHHVPHSYPLLRSQSNGSVHAFVTVSSLSLRTTRPSHRSLFFLGSSVMSATHTSPFLCLHVVFSLSTIFPQTISALSSPFSKVSLLRSCVRRTFVFNSSVIRLQYTRRQEGDGGIKRIYRSETPAREGGGEQTAMDGTHTENE